MNLLLILGWISATSAFASSDCNNLRISAKSHSTLDFTSNSTPTHTVTVRRNGNDGCSYFLTVDYGDAGSFAARRLERSGSYTIPVQIYRDAGRSQVIKKLPDASNNSEVIAGTFPDGTGTPQTVIHTFYPELGSVDYNRYGNYSDSYTIRLYEGTIGNHDQKDNESVTYTYSMVKKIDLSLVSTGGAFNAADTTETLNFGNLTTGAVRTFDIVVKYNAGYRLRLSSANQGNLKHVSAANLIPYTFTVNGSPVNLAGSHTSPVQATSGSGVSPANGHVFSSAITIGNVGNPRAGNYSDVVTVTVVTSE